jgi:hypothetical protein
MIYRSSLATEEKEAMLKRGETALSDKRLRDAEEDLETSTGQQRARSKSLALRSPQGRVGAEEMRPRTERVARTLAPVKQEVAHVRSGATEVEAGTSSPCRVMPAELTTSRSVEWSAATEATVLRSQDPAEMAMLVAARVERVARAKLAVEAEAPVPCCC